MPITKSVTSRLTQLRLVRTPLIASLVATGALALSAAPAQAISCHIGVASGDSIQALYGEQDGAKGISGPTNYRYVSCSGGFGIIILGIAMPIIEHFSGTTASVHMTALLHRTTHFRIRVEHITGQRTFHSRALGAVTEDAFKQVGHIALGKQHKGTAHLSFPLAVGGHQLSAGSYELLLEALKPNGSVRTYSLPLIVSVASNGTVQASNLAQQALARGT